jgi:hypothetical protein
MESDKDIQYLTSIKLTEYHKSLIMKAGMHQRLSQFIREQIEEHFGEVSLVDLKKEKESELLISLQTKQSEYKRSLVEMKNETSMQAGSSF